MCGFLFEQDLKGHPWQSLPNKKALEDLSIRGPDALQTVIEGPYRLSHARLSILDIVGGSQPMYNHDKSRVVVFNGEIFNHHDLRGKIGKEKFTSRSDTEVLLHLPDLLDPEDFLRSLRGMYAFAIVDLTRGLTLIARDSFGKKPHYYGIWDGTLYASSRLQTILYQTSTQPPIDPLGLAYYSDLGYIPSPFSIVSPIKKLLPGEWRVYDTTGTCVRSGIAKSTLTPGISDATPSLAFEQFKESLLQSISRRLESDVPLGYLLSDGLDSSTIVRESQSLIANSSDMQVFTFEQDGPLNEAPGAIHFANTLGISIYPIRFNPGVSDFLTIINRLDEPFADLSIFPTYSVFKSLKSRATVALTGDGGDELFGGYPSQFRQEFIANISNHEIPIPYPLQRIKGVRKISAAFSKDVFLYRRLQACSISHTRFSLDQLLSLPSIGDRIAALKLANPNFVTTASMPINEWCNHAGVGLADRMLTKVDTCSMAAAVEARSPFLDEDLWNKIISSNTNKVVFESKTPKQYIRTYAAPFKKAEKKMGFSADYANIRSLLGLGASSHVQKGFLANQDSAAIARAILKSWFVRNNFELDDDGLYTQKPAIDFQKI